MTKVATPTSRDLVISSKQKELAHHVVRVHEDEMWTYLVAATQCQQKELFHKR